MKSFIYPLTWEEFESLHREAWHNGWTYGPAYSELYEDYLVNWVYFVDYVDVLINARNKEHVRQYERIGADIVNIPLENGMVLLRHVPDAFESVNVGESNGPLKIFIGEAPPKWNWKQLPSKRTYFYHPLHTGSSTWFSVPKDIFKVKESNKWEALIKLATEQFLLLDIFPFPIIQDTEIRKEVTGEFGTWLKLYFVDYFKKCINYIQQNAKEINIGKEYALAIPLYGSLQICFGETSRKVIENEIDNEFYSKPIIELREKVHESWEIRLPELGESQEYNTTILADKSKDRYKFIRDINPSIKTLSLEYFNEEFKKISTVKIPMLTTGMNDLSSTEFINSIVKNNIVAKPKNSTNKK